jgi:MoxR-like ATPase
MTSNGEREFPPAFLRRCLRLQIEPPSKETLRAILRERLMPDTKYTFAVEKLLTQFVDRRDTQKLELATDQLLNAVYMVMQEINPMERQTLREALLQPLGETAMASAASPSSC